jgi:hypothetical protein
VTLIGVIILLCRLIGTAEADEIGSQEPIPSLCQRRDHLAVQVGPGGFAVHEEDHLAVTRSLVYVMDPQRATFSILNIEIIGGEGIVLQFRESLIRGSQGSHGKDYIKQDTRPANLPVVKSVPTGPFLAGL